MPSMDENGGADDYVPAQTIGHSVQKPVAVGRSLEVAASSA